MSRLTKIRIENFRSILNVDLCFNEISAFVGYNNAGKSNILKAIECFFKPGTKVSQENFYDSTKPISIIGKIEGITSAQLSRMESKHRDKIEKYIINGAIILKRVAKGDNEHKVETSIARGDEDFDTAKYDKNPTGISNALAGVVPDVVSITAMFDALADATKQKSGTTFSQLIAIVLAAGRDEFDNETKKDFNALNKYFKENKRIKQVSSGISQAFNQFFPGSSAVIKFDSLTFEDVLSKAGISVKGESDPIERSAEAYGQGLQRAAQMALIKYLADNNFGRDSSRGVIFLIDEPELYMHPQMIVEIGKTLVKMTQEETKNFQVFVTTHSPLIVRNETIVKNTFIVKKNNNVTSIAKRSDNLDKVITDVSKQYNIVVNIENLSKALFADLVIIAEGETERLLLPRIIFDMKGISESKIAVIDVGGKNNVQGVKTVLNAMGINAVALCDLDVLQHYKTAASYPDFKNKLDKFKLNLKDGSSGEVGAEVIKQFACVDENKSCIKLFCEEMKTKGYWFWRSGDIECVLYGSTLKKGEKVNKALTLLNNKDKCDWSKKVSELQGDAQELVDFVDWISTNI